MVRLKLGYEFLDVYELEPVILLCIYDDDLFLGDIHKLLVEFWKIYIQEIGSEFIFGSRKNLGLPLLCLLLTIMQV